MTLSQIFAKRKFHEFGQNKKITGQNKKIAHMWRRWGTPQNFFLAFIDELEKQIIIKKTVEVGQ